MKSISKIVTFSVIFTLFLRSGLRFFTFTLDLRYVYARHKRNSNYGGCTVSSLI